MEVVDIAADDRSAIVESDLGRQPLEAAPGLEVRFVIPRLIFCETAILRDRFGQRHFLSASNVLAASGHVDCVVWQDSCLTVLQREERGV